jgi:hypothetical protein
MRITIPCGKNSARWNAPTAITSWPAKPCEPDLAAIASKKRSEARKRHETLCELAQAMTVSLHAPRMEAVPALAAAFLRWQRTG